MIKNAFKLVKLDWLNYKFEFFILVFQEVKLKKL